jgi:raffinose/stachyose/melibiose transport system substrate-binding protein
MNNFTGGKKKMRKVSKVVVLLLALTMVFSLAACGTPAPSQAPSQAPTSAAPADTASQAPAEKVTVKLFTNLADRNAGQGKLEQMLVDQYMAENKNVTIEIEALQDEPYKSKFKAYTSSDQLPDVVSVWGQPAFIDPVINSGYLAELNASDYTNYNFLAGALSGFSKDGKIYGLARNSDMMVFYYNKAIFSKYGISVPTTFDELLAISDKLKDTGIATCAMDGKDKWPIAILYTDITLRYTGESTLIPKAVSSKSFAEPRLLEAANVMKKMNDAKFYQKSFTATDYGAARNMFAQGKSAMYYMGSWEMGMVSDDSLPADFRSNIGVFELPVISGGAGKITDIAAWNGGGYSVSAKSKVKDEAIKFLNYMFKPENWAKNAWQLGVCIPAQKFDEYLTGKETDVQKDLVKFLSGATSTSGTSINDLGTPSFKTSSEDLSQQFAAGMITPEEYLAQLEKAIKQ